MKAAIVRTPGQLSIEDIPMPIVGEYTALCQLLYGATCTATDQHIINQDVITSSLPIILGHESIGRVLETGNKVRTFAVGDRIARVGVPAMPAIGLDAQWGGFAQYGLAVDALAMQADGVLDGAIQLPSVNQVIPEDISDTTAPMMITWRETHSYITRMGLRAGMRVLILGSGGNGLSFMQHARGAGASFVLGIGSDGRSANAVACGADAYLSYRDETLHEQVAGYTENGFDLIIDAIGKPGQLDALLPFVAPNCTVGIYGIEGGNAMRMNPLRAAHTFRFYQDGYVEGEAHEAVVKDIRDGKLFAAPYYDEAKAYPLSGLCEAFDMLRRKESPKALINLQG